MTTGKLYGQDYYLWLKETVISLQDGRFTDLDIPNLVEKVENMARSENRVIRSNFIVVLRHLLKYAYQPDKRSNS